MTYPPQQPTPYGGQYPQQPQPYGQYPPQQNPYGQPGGYGYGMPPGPPPKKKAGPVIAITATALVVVALLVTGFAWPGWFIGDDKPAASPIGSTTSKAPADQNSSQAVAEAVIAKLNSRDVDGLARELACSGVKKQSSQGKGTNLEIDVYNAAPSLDPNNGSEVKKIKTEFTLVEVRQTKPGDLTYDPKFKDDHIAKIAVKFYNVPDPVKDQIKDGEGEIVLLRQKGTWVFCGMEIAGDGRGDDAGNTGSGGSANADPKDPNGSAEAFVAAVNNKDQAGADRLICASGTAVKTLTGELIKAGGRLTLNKPVAQVSQDSRVATMDLTGVAGGDTAKLLGSLWRETPEAPWCVNLIQMMQ